MAAGCLLPLGALAAEVTLVHGDFHVCNVITSRATGEIVAVLDWELATLGDPLADIGSLLAYWVQQDDRIGSTFTATALPGFPTREELAKTHLEESGRDPEALQSWFALGCGRSQSSPRAFCVALRTNRRTGLLRELRMPSGSTRWSPGCRSCRRSRAGVVSGRTTVRARRAVRVR